MVSNCIQHHSFDVNSYDLDSYALRSINYGSLQTNCSISQEKNPAIHSYNVAFLSPWKLSHFAVNQSAQPLISTFVVLFVVYACYGLWQHRNSQQDSKDPKTWPILGSQLQAAANYDRLIDWITSFFRDDHRTVKMSFMSRRSYLTVDPANVEHILKTNFQNFPKGEESHNRLFDMLGNGILNTDGSAWKAHRKLGSLEFSVKRLRHLSSTVYKCHALSLVHKLDHQPRDESVDMQELLLNMTFNSICEVVFGTAVKADICEDASIAYSLDNAQEMITRRYVFPWWRLQRLFNIGSERVLHRDITRFNQFLSCIIKRKRLQMQQAYPVVVVPTSTNHRARSDAAHNGHGGAMQDLLSRFISHQDATCNGSLTEKNKNDREVSEAMMSFIMAGRDTTASTLSWFLYCMCTQPHTQEKVFEELLQLESKKHFAGQSSFGNDDQNDSANINTGRAKHMKEFADNVLSYEALQSNGSPYLHATLAETLRLYPAVPRDGKVALRDDVLPDGTVLKAGDQVAYIPYAMGRMPFLWGDDATIFRPERWLSDGTFQPQSPFKFTAFQAGPRMCLGKDAAYLQMKITAAMLLRFFKFSLVPNHPVEYRMMMVMTMKHGLKVHLTRR